MARQVEVSASLPPQPKYILRGHSAQIHSVCFVRHNSRLLTGDAAGWVVVWNLTTKRAAVAWKAHEKAILGLGAWGEDKIITHGRDNKLQVWQLPELQESEFSHVLPVEDSTSQRKQPWLLHALMVNTLNFCAFASCRAQPSLPDDEQILVAVPGTREGDVAIYSLPSESLFSYIKGHTEDQTGMMMALRLLHNQGHVTVVAGYENGQTAVIQQKNNRWSKVYSAKVHSQPVLSLDVEPVLSSYFTSGADSIVARHPLDEAHADAITSQTKHAGQQSLRVRSDGRIFATAGWDGQIRVYSTRTMKELAVLKWHKEGCYALAFAKIEPESDEAVGEAQDDMTGGTSQDVAKLATQRTVQSRRTAKAQTTHWLAAGSKDGKVSLWDIY